jgi:hypothetical protein
MHDKASNRASWAYHGTDGWYIGPSMEHYRCVKCLDPQTNRTKDIDTIEFFPHSRIKIPKINTEDYLKQATDDIISILHNPPNTSIPSLEAGNPTRNAILRVALALNRAAKPPSSPQTEKVPATALRVDPSKIKTSPMSKQTLSLPSLPALAPRVHKTNQNFLPSFKTTYNYRNHYVNPSFRSCATQSIAAQHIYKCYAHHIYDDNGKKGNNRFIISRTK